MGCMTVGTYTGIRECYTIPCLNHWRHFLQIDLVHNAVACGNHIHIFEGSFRPLNKVEPIFVTAFFNGTVLFKSFGDRSRELLQPENGQQSTEWEQPGLPWMDHRPALQ